MQTQDTVLRAPTPKGKDEREFLRELSHQITDAVLSDENLAGSARHQHIQRRIQALGVAGASAA